VLKLRELQEADQAEFLAAAHEFDQEDLEQEFAVEYHRANGFKDYVRLLNCWSKGTKLPDNFVASTYLVAVVENKIVGRVSIRHELNDFLFRIGGHIGYAVIPSERGKGYATEILKQGLDVARKLDLTKVLITTDLDNFASQKVILKNSGKLEIAQKDLFPEDKLRYWIDLI
jgi:predicted acetyltransferase